MVDIKNKKLHDRERGNSSPEAENFIELNGKMKSHPVTLRFNKSLEEKFVKDTFKKNILQIRLVMGFGIILFLLFGILDYLLIPNMKNIFWIIVYSYTVISWTELFYLNAFYYIIMLIISCKNWQTVCHCCSAN